MYLLPVVRGGGMLSTLAMSEHLATGLFRLKIDVG
jgi:hypothetical protein